LSIINNEQFKLHVSTHSKKKKKTLKFPENKPNGVCSAVPDFQKNNYKSKMFIPPKTSHGTPSIPQKTNQVPSPIPTIQQMNHVTPPTPPKTDKVIPACNPSKTTSEILPHLFLGDIDR
jgi:hypothetical protein